MDHTLSREESKRLMSLLGLSMDQWGNFPIMRKAFLTKCKILHPDKGGDQELAKELISLYKRAQESAAALNPDTQFSTTQIPTYGTPEWEEWWRSFNQEFDIFCNEQFDRSDSEEEYQSQPPSQSQARSPSPEPEPSTSGYDSQSQSQRFKRGADEEDSQQSQATPPKRKKDNKKPTEMPDDLLPFLSAAILSNKTVTNFLVYTTIEKSEYLYRKLRERYKATFISRHRLEAAGFVYMITPSRHRVTAVQNFASALCSVSFLIIKAVIKPFECYQHLCLPPYNKDMENLDGGLNRDFFDVPEEAARLVSWKQITDYALATNCDDVFLLMGQYKEFAQEVEGCKKCDEKIFYEHYNYHKMHTENAQVFLDCRNQKTICQQAVDGVIAQRRLTVAQMTREQLLAARFKELFARMDSYFSAKSSKDIKHYMAGAVWYMHFFPGIDMKDFITEFLQAMVDNIPKRRYWLFTGPVNTGKTTLASALLDLCGGKSLNINMPFDKLNFELGVAIDQFMVVFEDVKGQVSDNKDLPPGQGIHNLDNLRDYIDGAVPVNLEKKHLNKKTQIFPPGLVTCNEYVLPITLKVRLCRRIKFTFNKNQFLALRRTDCLYRHRILQSGISLLLLLIYECGIDEFDKEVQELVEKWKKRIDEDIGDYLIDDMKANCAEGKDLFHKR
ncbi:putative large T antigen [Myotis polyomavirus VM-2008]|uniref:Large T antigen n=1 Tax=Myotis polyomavirus VM-2008 TaxID=563775 RepID=B6E002_9POLY|nr:putative large T antigen [Myotis polyomavirus VM-2008]ACI16490.1 putative large T antigen [Myotis polyomavirus VM-2008]